MADEKIMRPLSTLDNSTNAIKFPNNGSFEEVYRFSWHNDEKQQGLILGSYFWAYTAFQVPSGRLAER